MGKGSKPERKPGLHREVSRRSTRKNKTYFLSCRDTAKGVPGLRHQQAYNINLAVVELDDAIEIVRRRQERRRKSYRISVSPVTSGKDAACRLERPAEAYRAECRFSIHVRAYARGRFKSLGFHPVRAHVHAKAMSLAKPDQSKSGPIGETSVLSD